MRLEPLAVPRPLVVEREARWVGADLREPGRLEAKLERHRAARARRRRGRAVGDVERVREQDLLRVRQQQLLMLLLVVQAELDEAGELGIVGARREEIERRVVDTGTVIMNLRNGRSAQVAALGARVHVADRVVVRVEDPLVTIVDGRVAGLPRAEDEALEEPGRVPQVPLRRARFDARLDDLVLDGERRRELERRVAHRAVPVGEEAPERVPPYWVDEQASSLQPSSNSGVRSLVQSLCQGNGRAGMVSAASPRRGGPRERGMTAMKYAGILFPLVSAAGLTLLSACNTVEGVGRDIERAGDAIQDEADDAQDRRRRDD